MTEKEISLLKSTGDRSAAQYKMLIEDFVRELDIRSEIIGVKLSGFETTFERMRLNELRSHSGAKIVPVPLCRFSI